MFNTIYTNEHHGHRGPLGRQLESTAQAQQQGVYYSMYNVEAAVRWLITQPDDMLRGTPGHTAAVCFSVASGQRSDPHNITAP